MSYASLQMMTQNDLTNQFFNEWRKEREMKTKTWVQIITSCTLFKEEQEEFKALLPDSLVQEQLGQWVAPYYLQ